MKVTIRKAASNSARLDRQTNVLHLSDKVPAKNIEISEENSGKNIFSICLKKMTVSYCSIMNR